MSALLYPNGDRLGRATLAAFLILSLAGCHAEPRGGRLEASWIGSDSGHFAAPAKAAWCPVAGRLEVTAIQEDAGFGIALYPAGELVDGEYPVIDSAADSVTDSVAVSPPDSGTDSIARPSASGAYRNFTEQVVAGFQGDSGSVSVTHKGGRVELSFLFRMASTEGKDTIEAKGSATGLLPGDCPSDSIPKNSPVQ